MRKRILFLPESGSFKEFIAFILEIRETIRNQWKEKEAWEERGCTSRPLLRTTRAITPVRQEAKPTPLSSYTSWMVS